MRQLIPAVVICIMLAFALGAQAGAYAFTPYSPNLKDLAHGSYYTWGINWTKPAEEVITSATLTFKHIWDWTVEEDHLYMHLFDTVTDPNASNKTPNWRQMVGYQTISWAKSDSRSGDQFDGQGYAFEQWNDPAGGQNGKYAIDLNRYLPVDKFAWLEDGNFGFGIDPDCHYYNSGVELVVTTMPKPSHALPEANTLMLAALGLGSLGGFRRLRRG